MDASGWKTRWRAINTSCQSCFHSAELNTGADRTAHVSFIRAFQNDPSLKVCLSLHNSNCVLQERCSSCKENQEKCVCAWRRLTQSPEQMLELYFSVNQGLYSNFTSEWRQDNIHILALKLAYFPPQQWSVSSLKVVFLFLFRHEWMFCWISIRRFFSAN